MSPKLVTVTGAGGYIGSVTLARLLEMGYAVKAIDRFFFGEAPLQALRDHPRLSMLRCDIRDITPYDLEGSWAVVDLAALSNDPSGDLDFRLTEDINCNGRTRVAKAAKAAGVERYVFASSCSVYGTGNGANLTEDSPVRPLTAYARSCAEAEEVVRGLNGPGFTAIALRNATVFGLSPRMRFDLVVNLMTVHAFETRRITIRGGGRQWRPLVHVQDVASAILCAMRAPPATAGGEAFNIGLANFQVRQIASVVRATLPFRIRTHIAPDDADRRDYNVSFDRAADGLGFTARNSVAYGVGEIYEALLGQRVAHDEHTETVAWYRYLLKAKRVLQEVELNHRLL